MIIPILFGDGEQLGAQYESSLFGDTQFNVAVKNLKAYFKTLNDSVGNTIDIKKAVGDYVYASLASTVPYVKSELEAWIRRMMAKGLTRAQSILFLGALRRLNEEGLVGDAVYAPYDWSLRYPDEKTGLNALLESAYKAVSLPSWVKPVAIGVAILGALYVARPYVSIFSRVKP